MGRTSIDSGGAINGLKNGFGKKSTHLERAAIDIGRESNGFGRDINSFTKKMLLDRIQSIWEGGQSIDPGSENNEFGRDIYSFAKEKN